MKEIYKYKIELEGLEDKLSRVIEINSNSTLADLVYVILTSFELYFNDYFCVLVDDDKYDCVISLYDSEEYKSAMKIKIKDIKNQKITLEYNFKNKIVFTIKYLDNLKVKDDSNYPNILEGFGSGIPGDVSFEELKKIIEETDKLGHSNYYNTIINVDGEEEQELYDYREFDLEINNILLKGNWKLMKDDYEQTTLIDILRIIKERMNFFYKSDIKEIVNPFDYIKKYIPKNYNKLSSEEIKKLNIPGYEELNIYMLPTYEKLNHKEIMTSYVKSNVDDKEIRQALFYVLRNHHYMDKFYNKLRKYGLIKEYLDYSNDYYQEILDDWMKKNNISEK